MHELGGGKQITHPAAVASGKAKQLSFSGYPNRFTAQAGDILPLLASGPSAHAGPAVIGDDYVMQVNWKGKPTFHQDKIATCSPEQSPHENGGREARGAD